MNKFARIIVLAGVLLMATSVRAEEVTFYVGGYTPRSDAPITTGITQWTIDTESGAMKQVGEPAIAKNPSFIAWSSDKKKLYAVSEVGNPGGGVKSFAVSSDGSLIESHSIGSGGGAPCYLSLDQTGRHLLAANYGGSVVTFALDGKNDPSRIVNAIDHAGSSINEQRQKGPHPHSIVASSDNSTVFVPDLGQDKLIAYSFDAASGKIVADSAKNVSTPPGSGPRHLIFHPRLPYAYASLELSNEIVAYRSSEDALEQIDIKTTLPADFIESNTTAEVRIHPNGKFAYISNRGHDSIAGYRIDQQDGTLTPIGIWSALGKTPRNFNIDSAGSILIAAHQQSDSLASFFIDSETGVLTPTGHTAKTPIPTYILL